MIDFDISKTDAILMFICVMVVAAIIHDHFTDGR